MASLNATETNEKQRRADDKGFNDESLVLERSRHLDEPIATFDPTKIGNMIAGMAVTDKFSFTKKIDLGVPFDPIEKGSSHVLLLYGHKNAVPNKVTTKVKDGPFMIPDVAFEEAVAKCNTLNIWLLDHLGVEDTCWALVPQMGSHHIQKWKRMKPVSSFTQLQIDHNEPLRRAPRAALSHGRVFYPSPKERERQMGMDFLHKYFISRKQVLQDVKGMIGQDVRPYEESIVVMVCNYAQIDVLMNFACSARSRQLDTSSILVFATDKETFQMVKSLGLAVIYLKQVFDDIPAEPSGTVDQLTKTLVLISKILCSWLVLSLGYNILYHDLDIVWFKEPLRDFFSQEWANEYDIIFQDDGSHTPHYAPYFGNAGCFFARHNEMTLNLFDAVLLSAEAIFSTGNEQMVMLHVLSDHVSLYGLRAKVVNRDTWELPAGWNFHRSSNYQYMKDHFLLNKGSNKSQAILYHMNWTDGKEDKIKFFQQLGEWFVNQTCVTGGQQTMLSTERIATDSFNFQSCCFAQGEFKCHFKDRPSLHPCPDHPPIEQGGRSFW